MREMPGGTPLWTFHPSTEHAQRGKPDPGDRRLGVEGQESGLSPEGTGDEKDLADDVRHHDGDDERQNSDDPDTSVHDLVLLVLLLS